ncbi:hypothetical protein HDU79_007910 [Rhizoclosmatium sp. JEL0117]|nr:hypothetical protein HDU79_007910 [Rhizoclosmatium sp. JEL0117]
MPPYYVDPHNVAAYPQYETLENVIAQQRRDLAVNNLPGGSGSSPSSPTVASTVYTSLTHPNTALPIAAGFVAIGIVASVFLFVHYAHERKKPHLDHLEHIVKSPKIDHYATAPKLEPLDLKKDNILKSVALPPPVFQERTGNKEEESVEVMSLMLKIRGKGKIEGGEPPAIPQECHGFKNMQRRISGGRGEGQRSRPESLIAFGDSNLLSTQLTPSSTSSDHQVNSVPVIQIEAGSEGNRTRESSIAVNEATQIDVHVHASTTTNKSEKRSVPLKSNCEVSSSLGEIQQLAQDSKRSSCTSVSILSSQVMRYRVERPWIPQQKDELALKVGDIVHVYQVFNDCWCEGFVDDDVEEKEGMFPRECLGEHPLSLWDLAGAKAELEMEPLDD